MPDQPHHCVQVPATSANLGPGYDVFGVALGRHLVVRSVPRSSQAPRIVTSGDGGEELPTDDSNLIWRSIVDFCEREAVAVPEVALRASTQIPLERGLGSSSAAIVAGLALARALTGVTIGDRDLVQMAAEIEGHPDNVAPALLGGFVTCVVDDDGALVVRRINPATHLEPMVFVPRSRQSTTQARGVVPHELPCDQIVDQVGRAGHVLGALAGLWPVAASAVGDRLHEPNRLTAMGPSGKLVDRLRRQGMHAWLSGAGPSVAALVGSPLQRPAAPDLTELRSIADELAFAFLTPRFDLAGALVCPDGGCALAAGSDCVQCPRRRV